VIRVCSSGSDGAGSLARHRSDFEVPPADGGDARQVTGNGERGDLFRVVEPRWLW